MTKHHSSVCIVLYILCIDKNDIWQITLQNLFWCVSDLLKVIFSCLIVFFQCHIKSMPWLWIYAMINNYEYIGARNTPCWFSWSIHLRMSCFSSIVVSWVMERVWTVRDTVPGRCCSRAGSVRSPGVITVSPHDSQNASLAAHRTTAVMSARITMTTSARLRGNWGHPHLFC